MRWGWAIKSKILASVAMCAVLGGCATSSNNASTEILATRYIEIIPESEATSIRPNATYVVEGIGGSHPVLSIATSKALTGPVYRQAIETKRQEKFHYKASGGKTFLAMLFTAGLAGFAAAADEDIKNALMDEKVSDGYETFDEPGERTRTGKTATFLQPWPSAALDVVIRNPDGAVAGRRSVVSDQRAKAQVALNDIFSASSAHPSEVEVVLAAKLGGATTEIPVALSTELLQKVAASLGRAQPSATPQTVNAQPSAGPSPLTVKFPQGPDRPDDIAVIIGNRNYSRGGRAIPDVAPAIADSEAIRRYVREARGIADNNIFMIKDATQSNMVSLFGNETHAEGQVFNAVKPGRSRVFVYYSGHGAPGANDRQSYLVPVDANPATLELNGYSLATLYRNLGRIPAESVTVVLEACFSGASQDGAVLPNASPIFVEPTAAAVPPGLTVFTASGPREIASWEPDKSFSLFTKYFLLGVSGQADKTPSGNEDGRVGNAELLAYLKETVTYHAKRFYGREQHVDFLTGTK